MISYDDSMSEAESDSIFESEAQEYGDSDKADSDIEIELYNQIYYVEDLGASTVTQTFQNDSNVTVSTIESTDSFSSLKSKERLAHSVKEDKTGLVRFNHFESSTPKYLLENDLIVRKQMTENDLNMPAKLHKAKAKKGKSVTSSSNFELNRSSEDLGCSESVIIYSDKGGDTDDSVICLDSDEHCDISNIMMNMEGGEDILSKDVILLDSTATSDEDLLVHNSAFSNPSDSESSLKMSFSGTSSIANQSSDLWHIDHEDRFSFIKKRNRYHQKRTLICYNCNKKGHLSKDCVEPRNKKCYICGRNHVWSMCHQRICGKCFEYGHSSPKCRYKACEITCNLCKMRGHYMLECPDIWRRYHLTTSPDVIVKGAKELPSAVKKYCYNCGHEGHYGHECLKPRMSPDSFPTWPFIISYRDPSRYLKKHLKTFSTGESSNSSRHYDSRPRRKHNKKHTSRADKLQGEISEISETQSENYKKLKNKHKSRKKQFKVERYNRVFKGNDFPRSPSIIRCDEDIQKRKKRKRSHIERLYAFKRKKQKLNASVE